MKILPLSKIVCHSGSAGATVALRLLKERAESAEGRAAASMRQAAELKASLNVIHVHVTTHHETRMQSVINRWRDLNVFSSLISVCCIATRHIVSCSGAKCVNTASSLQPDKVD